MRWSHGAQGRAEFAMTEKLGMTEKKFMQNVIDLANILGFAVYHTHDSRRSQSGWPDLVMVKDGRFVAAELKSENGPVTASQQAWLDELAMVPGIESYLWRPSMWDDIIATLQRRPE